MPQQIRMAALAITLIVAFSGFSLAQYYDDDHGYSRGLGQARQ